MNELDENQTPHSNLYAMLCDFHWFATHPFAEEDGLFHRDEQGEAFADRVFEFIKKELEQK